METRLTKRLLEAGYTIKIADKRKSVTYPELWLRCDVRNSGNETREFPASLTDEAMAPDADKIAKESQPMHSLLEVLKGSENICRACSELGIHRIIFTSSVAVYGFAPVGTDESGEIKYFNDYGRTKYLAEEKYHEWLKADSSNSVTIIRPTVIFGEENRGNVYNLLRQIAGGKFPMVGKGTNRKSMNYIENVAAFIQFCVENEEKLPCFENDFDGTKAGMQHLFNYCDEPAYDMNHLVLDCYKALGKPKTKLFHFPYALAYFGGLCFDLLAIILHKKFAINSIRVKKFCQNTYFKSSRVPQTEFSAPVSLEEGLRRTIDYEFVRKVEEHTFSCE